MRALIAPDKFKGSLTAVQVAQALAAGLRTAGVETASLPLADGGDGSVAAAVAAGFTPMVVDVVDALGAPRRSTIAMSGETAVVEIADTCGLVTLPPRVRDALGASSVGFGLAVGAAIDAGAVRIVLALGGSASTDAGLGFLSGLGYRFLSADGEELPPNGGSLKRVARVVDGRDLVGVELIVAGDVRNPLVGADGAAAVYAPQKGASPEVVTQLETGLRAFVETLGRVHPNASKVATEPGSGAAGGVGFAALLLGGRMTSGAEYFLDLLDFDELAAGVDLLVTGEGSIDAQTANGKLLATIIARGRRPGCRCNWAV